MRLALLRRFLDGDAKRAPVAARPARPIERAPAPARPRLVEPAPPPPAAGRPDLLGFARDMRHHAAIDAQGWTGNRKAYISHTWRRIREARAGWGLSEIEFKCMLAEAHRAGHVVLAHADLKDNENIKDLQDSALVFKNAIFHFIRVDG